MLVERVGSDVRLHRSGPLDATVRLPGSKSLTNRHLVCAALADGRSVLHNASFCDDAARMIEGLGRLGIRSVSLPEADRVEVEGCRGHLPADEGEIDAGDAGTVMRFLTALVTLGHGRYRLDGSDRMRERPIGPLADGLRELGAAISYEQRAGYPPLTVVTRGLLGGTVALARPVSSQFVSALLLVAPYASRDVMLRIDGGPTSRPYVDMTVAVMRALGVEVLCTPSADRFVVPSTQRYQAQAVTIEPDASAATYFWSAAAVCGGRVTVAGLGRDSVQGDVGFVELLARMGCAVEQTAAGLTVCGPTGRLRGIDADLSAMPDAAPTLAVVALFADGPTRIRNVANLRIKETDRLAALERELSRLGATVEPIDDGLTIHPPTRLRPATIETYNDHRMAMSFAVAGLAAGDVVIRAAECVAKSFPGFFETLGELARTQ